MHFETSRESFLCAIEIRWRGAKCAASPSARLPEQTSVKCAAKSLCPLPTLFSDISTENKCCQHCNVRMSSAALRRACARCDLQSNIEHHKQMTSAVTCAGAAAACAKSQRNGRCCGGGGKARRGRGPGSGTVEALKKLSRIQSCWCLRAFRGSSSRTDQQR